MIDQLTEEEKDYYVARRVLLATIKKVAKGPQDGIAILMEVIADILQLYPPLKPLPSNEEASIEEVEISMSNKFKKTLQSALDGSRDIYDEDKKEHVNLD